ncbi:MAG: hypothetical protein DRJ52_01405 [Thermoprotei archaeon]|nr:MAG: hypothetical protein DRJ52_01405 [Thermoprotei archaeon]
MRYRILSLASSKISSDPFFRLREKCARVVEYVEPFSGTVHRFKVYGAWVIGEEYRCEYGEYFVSVHAFEDWFDIFSEEPWPPESEEWLEHRLPKEFKVEGKVLGSWISKAGNTVIIVVEEEVTGVLYRFLYWWNKRRQTYSLRSF